MRDTDPATRSNPPARPADELVLAAVERAVLHRPHDGDAVPTWSVIEHLALPRRSGAARHVARRLEAMRAGGWLEQTRRHGAPTWALTSAGTRRLRARRRAGAVPELPESPQHRAWRLAHAAARRQIARVRGELRERLDRADSLLASDRMPGADVWLAEADALWHACQRLAGVSYCAHEWREPDDGEADVDERIDPGDEQLAEDERARRRARRAGRRNTLPWDRRERA